ncbi:MAG: hypothetical protein EZS28_008473 [Streblomastix strix]|uniref:Uncharacterized protein n=1 Tax=Streblomastix strix TaxID=222440 RepID=A0A5J4WMD8_9EUKA|nr:MAG: hypothetical protein EZS28_008473 [Streblomastix strix]
MSLELRSKHSFQMRGGVCVCYTCTSYDEDVPNPDDECDQFIVLCALTLDEDPCVGCVEARLSDYVQFVWAVNGYGCDVNTSRLLYLVLDGKNGCALADYNVSNLRVPLYCLFESPVVLELTFATPD